MKKLMTVTTVVVASLALSTAAFAGGHGGYKKHNSAKTLTFALSGAKHRVAARSTGCGCYGFLNVDAQSYQAHKTYSGKHGTGGESSAGNYLKSSWKGGAQIQFEGSAFAVGGALISSGGSKKMPRRRTR